MTTVSSSSLVFCCQAGESDDALEVNDPTPQNPREATSIALFDIPRCKHNNDLIISSLYLSLQLDVSIYIYI